MNDDDLKFRTFGTYLVLVCQELKDIWGWRSPLTFMDASKVDVIYEGFEKRISVEDTAYKVNSLLG